MKGEILKLPYAVDFDGCLAESVYPDLGMGGPIDDNLAKLNEVAGVGHEITIHTSRPWYDYAKLERWLKANGVPFNGIICGKYLALRYVDDKSINSQEDSWL